ncbi:STAS domain-containing protein [Streptomyces massasporeus]|uniref:STAS domain-containing protein n=1 Tax=Streptomyces massasporeus TaxID=67324 RepID=UPI001673AD86|nr:STAS domain-containing protein [Streptomyces massasporeus]GGV83033.1 anti-sigma factor antagonist [Streptomyces massasporeus]
MGGPSVEVSASGWCLVARVSGEMDYVSGPSFGAEFLELTARSERLIVLELSGVSFCDSAGLNVLLQAWRQADSRGTVVVLANVSRPVRRVLQMTGVDQLLRVYDTAGDAEGDFGC